MGVTVRQKIPGKGKPWWVFVAYNGKRTSRMVGSKDAAIRVATNIEARLQLGEFEFGEAKEEKREATFKEYADSWITTIAPASCKESTVRSYDDLLRLHVLPAFGSLKLSEINRGKVKDFFAGKILEGYAQNTVRHMRDVISNVLNKAVDDETIKNNVSMRIKITQKIRNGENAGEDNNGEVKDPLTAEEAILLLNTVRNDVKAPYPLSDHYPLLLLLLRTGMRIGEALALQWGDIDFNGRFIHVQRGLSRKKIETPKSGKTRRIDMTPHLSETLATYKMECKKKGLALGLGDAPELVFTNGKGEFLDVNNWRRRTFNRALRKAGLRRIRVHDLRHTYATLRISKGDNIADVAGQLGHADVTMTLKVYYHWLPGGKKSEVDALDNLGTEKQKRKKAQNES
jgi:integrase